jgi:CRISPR/Cas system-associated endonuclease Cas1
MKGTKVLEIRQTGYGSLFSTRQGTLLFKTKKGETSYPLFEKEIGSIILRTGGMTTIGALCTCSFYSIPVIFVTSRGNPVGYLRSFDDDSFVETRVAQYESVRNGKGEAITLIYLLMGEPDRVI